MEKINNNQLISNIKCCKDFIDIAHTFNWMSYFDEDVDKKVYCLPNIELIRINTCPCCGKSINGINLTEE